MTMYNLILFQQPHSIKDNTGTKNPAVNRIKVTLYSVLFFAFSSSSWHTCNSLFFLICAWLKINEALGSNSHVSYLKKNRPQAIPWSCWKLLNWNLLCYLCIEKSCIDFRSSSEKATWTWKLYGVFTSFCLLCEVLGHFIFRVIILFHLKRFDKIHILIHAQCSCILEFDGASKGNPGPSGAGAVLRVIDGSLVYTQNTTHS